jgi:hypothetical protein
MWHFILVQGIEHRLENTLLLSAIGEPDTHTVCVVAGACFRDGVLCLGQGWNVRYDPRIARYKANWSHLKKYNKTG